MMGDGTTPATGDDIGASVASLWDKYADALAIADSLVLTLRAALTKYGRHIYPCPLVVPMSYSGVLPCSCGFDDARSQP
jgi:hypothetical protein